jgi:hypothetical protein
MRDERVVHDITAATAVRPREDGSVDVNSLAHGGLGINLADGTIQQAVAANVWETMHFSHVEYAMDAVLAETVGHTMMVSWTGLYMVLFYCNFTSGNNTSQWRFRLSIDGVGQNYECGATVVTAAQYVTASMNPLVSFVPDQVIRMEIRANGAHTATIRNAVFSIVRMGIVTPVPA